MIDLACRYFGETPQPSARLSTFVQRPGKDDQLLDPTNDSALLALQFENSAAGVIQESTAAHVGNRRLEQHVVLHGKEGELEVDVDSANGYTVRGARHDGEQIHVLATPDALLVGVVVYAP